MKVALYSRVSSDRQDVDLSISAQLKALRKYAQENNHQVAAEFVDEAETGRTSARPEFKKMISIARRLDKPFDLILVYKYSRFARNREDSIVFKAMLKKKGIQVISITEPFDDTPTGRLFQGFIESMDEFYSDNLGEEVTRGMRESASRGFYLSAKPPYGYHKVRVKDGSKERTRLDLNPSQMNTVQAIFNDILNGRGLIEIVRELNARAVPGPNNKGWSKNGVYGILNNEIYTGTLVWGRNSKRGLDPVRVENTCPVIVDRDTFDRVQKMLHDRAPARVHPRRMASRFLLSGLTRCGYCGKALIGRDAKSGKFSYYVCGTLDKKGAGACPSRYLNSRKLEGLVVDKIKEHILTEDNLTRLVSLVNEQMDGASGEYRDELKLISREEESISVRLDKLYDAVETGNISLDDLTPRIRELRSRQEQLLSRRIELEALMSDRKVELADLSTVKDYASDLRHTLDESPLSERKAFIRSFVENIIVTKEEAQLSYTIPLLPKGLTEERAGVLPIVRYGGRYWT
jgi:site-specific DNA recombinase